MKNPYFGTCSYDSVSDEARSQNMSSKIITTRDGSQSLFSGRFQQHYHNIAGALTESRNVFFDNTGLSRALADHRDITLCEVGFGTGLHVALVEGLRKRIGSRSQVHYYSVEKYPLEGDVVRQMGFGRICPGMDEEVGQIADALFSAREGDRVSVTLTSDQQADGPDEPKHANSPKNQPVSEKKSDKKTGKPSQKTPGKVAGLLAASEGAEYHERGNPAVYPMPTGTPFTRVEVYRGDFHDWDMTTLNRKADFILHDAFSPDVNPDLWTVATFRKLLQAAGPQAMLGTYCSSTRARAAMLLAGWHVGRVPGPPGKREVTIASPDEAMLAGFKRVNEALLMDRFREEL